MIRFRKIATGTGNTYLKSWTKASASCKALKTHLALLTASAHGKVRQPDRMYAVKLVLPSTTL